jgi:PAS domain S-box-containing protein
LYDADGSVVGVVNMTLDLSERKKAELVLAERNMQLDLAGKVALVGTFGFDVIPGRMTISPGYAAIHGLPEGTQECSRADWRARVHPDDLARLEARFEQTIAERRQDHHCDYRIVRPDGEVRWIESRSFVMYDGDGPRLVGANIDVTDRKRVERALSERNMQLSLAGKAAGVGSYAYDVGSELMQVTEGYAALHGLPEGTTETTRRALQERIHPGDRAWIDQVRPEVFGEHRQEYGIEYRIMRPGGEMRWIESRSFISYDDEGRPRRVIGVNIDVTERRRAEVHQRVLTAELDHRVKNVLATVAAVAASTLETSSSMHSFVAALDARIRAIASTHELLSTQRWQGLPLDELLSRQLAPYSTQNNTRINGPDVLLMAEAGQAVAMVLHELVTNAAKYGALSTQKGRVSVRWRWHSNGAERDALVIDWQEVGGPAVSAPSKIGYGTSVINDLVPYELGGKVEFDHARSGVRCRLEVPARWVINARRAADNSKWYGSADPNGRDT